MTGPVLAARQGAGAAVVLAITGLTLTGCNFNSSAPGNGSAGRPAAVHRSGKPGPGKHTSPGRTGRDSTTARQRRITSRRPGSQAAGPRQRFAPSFFPIQAGNTWVYQTHLDSQRGTTITRITRIVTTARGKSVTMTVRNSVTRTGRAGKVAVLQYLFRPDGSMIVPLRSIGAGSAVIESGTVTWPSPAALAAGKSRTSTVTVREYIGGRTWTVQARATVRADRSQTIPVPAGIYHAQVIDETLQESVAGILVSFKLRFWVVRGVGPVRSELVTSSGSVASPGAVEELQSFARGRSRG